MNILKLVAVFADQTSQFNPPGDLSPNHFWQQQTARFQKFLYTIGPTCFEGVAQRGSPNQQPENSDCNSIRIAEACSVLETET